MTPEQRDFILSLDLDGTMRPQDLLEHARPKGSPIHDLFTWDDAVAGERHRLSEARQLMGRIRVEYSVHIREIRSPAYVRNPELSARESGYIRTSLLKTRGEAAREALDYELAHVAALVARTRAIASELGLEAYCETRLRAMATKEKKRAAG